MHNLLIGQSGGPTAVINASLAGAIAAAQRETAIDTIYGMRFGIEGFMEGKTIDLTNCTRAEIDMLRQTPGSALGSCRHKLQDEELPRVLELLKEHDIRFMLLIGGNDTMDTITRIEHYARQKNYELYGIGIPKTVDNDLFGTDHTPGYGSAARYVALSVRQSGRLASDMRRVDRYVIHQTVGRDVGWLAAASAAARQNEGDAPHIICVPESPLEKSALIAHAKKIIDSWGYCSIVIGEGALWNDGTPISASQTKDKFGNIEFGAMGGSSAALSLHQLLAQETGFRGEFQITESLAMCAADRASQSDRSEAWECGEQGVALAAAQASGLMVSMVRTAANPYTIQYKTAPLQEVARNTRPLPPEFLDPKNYFVTQEFLDYLKPLIGEPFPSHFTAEKYEK